MFLFTVLLFWRNTDRPAHNQLTPGHGFEEQSKSSSSAPLLDDSRTSDAVVDCITGNVVGVRPRNVDTVDVCLPRSSSDNEVDDHRKAMFNEIFQKRLWGKDASIDFSSSGTVPPIHASSADSFLIIC